MVAVDSSPSPCSSRAWSQCQQTVRAYVQCDTTNLLVCLATGGEYPVGFSDLILPSTSRRVLQVIFETLDDVTATVSSCLRQICAFDVVDLDLDCLLHG